MWEHLARMARWLTGKYDDFLDMPGYDNPTFPLPERFEPRPQLAPSTDVIRSDLAALPPPSLLYEQDFEARVDALVDSLFMANAHASLAFTRDDYRRALRAALYD